MLPTLAELLDCMPLPVVIVSGDLKVAVANAMARALFPALRRNELLARALASTDLLDAVMRVRDGGTTEHVIWHKSVPVETVHEVSVMRIDMAATSSLIVLGICDLTEAYRLEKMRTGFVANVSHELRTPLASALGFVETLHGPARDDAKTRARLLAVMAAQARRMSRLIDDLPSLSRIERSQHLAPRDTVDLAVLVHIVADMLSHLADDRQITLRIDAPASVTVMGDCEELVRVIENLIENAIKYSSSGTGKVRAVDVKVDKEGKMGRLIVTDEGPASKTVRSFFGRIF